MNEVFVDTYSFTGDKSYIIPAKILKGENKSTIKIKSVPGNITGDIWGYRTPGGKA